MHVDAYITVVCEEVGRGCEFRALFFDRATGQFYGGSGPTALEAVAWCMSTYVERAFLGRPHRLSVPHDATPLSILEGA